MILLRNAWAHSGFAWKFREFLLAWKKGYVSIICSFSQNSPCFTLFPNGKVRCIPDSNGGSFWALLFRLMGFLSILFSACGHFSIGHELLEWRRKELQADSLCRSMVNFGMLQQRVGEMFIALPHVRLGSIPLQHGHKFGLGSISRYFFCVDASWMSHQ